MEIQDTEPAATVVSAAQATKRPNPASDQNHSPSKAARVSYDEASLPTKNRRVLEIDTEPAATIVTAAQATKRPYPASDQKPSTSKAARVSYDEASLPTKNRRVLEIVNNYHPDAIIRAAIKVLQNQGHNDASRVLEKIHKDSSDLSQAQSFLNEVSKEKGKVPSVISPVRALHHKLEIGLSTRQYDKTCQVGNPPSIDKVIWPPRNQLENESKKLRPEVIYKNIFCN